MSNNKKVGLFSAFLFVGVAALFFPATALENSIANAQEEVYPLYYEEDSDGYYNDYNEENDYSYKDNIKKDPIVVIKKKLFVCRDAAIPPPDPENQFFACTINAPGGFFYPAGPNSGQYIPCTEELCPLIDESDFSVQIFKDVATVRDLTPQGTPVNLDKFHYSVTERAINDIIATDDNDFVFSQCLTPDFRHSLSYTTFTQDLHVQYLICVNYVGDCDGTIYPGEVKTCTVENYIWLGQILDSPPGNAINGVTTGNTSQSNNATTTTTTTKSSNVGVLDTFSSLVGPLSLAN